MIIIINLKKTYLTKKGEIFCLSMNLFETSRNQIYLSSTKKKKIDAVQFANLFETFYRI